MRGAVRIRREAELCKIRELLFKNFGKFTGKKIVLKDGINLFYGENESGKTTIHTFIKGMLFGLERGRGRASVNDTFSIYEPWENPNYYSGMLRFESGGKNFLLERNFDKYSKSARLISARMTAKNFRWSMETSR
ncbi:MAG: ATP-binding protein [Coprococcus sp.]